MKKLLAVVVLALIVPVGAKADDIENPDQCRAHGDGVFIQQIPLNRDDSEAEQRDRGSGCVNVGDTQVVYVGGELQAEDPQHENGPCGAVVVMNENVTDNEDLGLDGQDDFTHEDCD